MSMEEEYISKIVLELQPRSRRGYRRLLGIRENKSFNKDLFNRTEFTTRFLLHFNERSLQRGKHIHFENLIVAVKQIQRTKATDPTNTEVEFLLQGLPLRDEQRGKSNESFKDDRNLEEVFACYCSECQKCLREGEYFVKSGNWSRPIVCLSCFESLFTEKCVRCQKSITFDDSMKNEEFHSIRFIEHNGCHWHSECCVCVTCLESLVGKKFYQDEDFNQLFCLEHIPYRF